MAFDEASLFADLFTNETQPFCWILEKRIKSQQCFKNISFFAGLHHDSLYSSCPPRTSKLRIERRCQPYKWNSGAWQCWHPDTGFFPATQQRNMHSPYTSKGLNLHISWPWRSDWHVGSSQMQIKQWATQKIARILGTVQYLLSTCTNKEAK